MKVKNQIKILLFHYCSAISTVHCCVVQYLNTSGVVCTCKKTFLQTTMLAVPLLKSFVLREEGQSGLMVVIKYWIIG